MTAAGVPPAGAAGSPAIGVDIGGTTLAAGLVTPDGEVLDTAVRPAPATSARAAEDVRGPTDPPPVVQRIEIA